MSFLNRGAFLTPIPRSLQPCQRWIERRFTHGFWNCPAQTQENMLSQSSGKEFENTCLREQLQNTHRVICILRSALEEKLIENNELYLYANQLFLTNSKYCETDFRIVFQSHRFKSHCFLCFSYSSGFEKSLKQ